MRKMNTSMKCAKVINQIVGAISTVDTAEQAEVSISDVLIHTGGFKPEDAKKVAVHLSFYMWMNDMSVPKTFEYMVPFLSGYMMAKEVIA